MFLSCLIDSLKRMMKHLPSKERPFLFRRPDSYKMDRAAFHNFANGISLTWLLIHRRRLLLNQPQEKIRMQPRFTMRRFSTVLSGLNNQL